MARVVVVVATLLVALVAVAQAQAVLRAINGASKTLEWTSTSSGDLTFSHNGKNYLSFLTANSNNADLPQGVVVGDAEAEIPGSIRFHQYPDGSSDIEGFVRGRWLSLSRDDPKNLFTNGFEVASVASDSIDNNLVTANDRFSYTLAAQVFSAYAGTAVDPTQTYVMLSLIDIPATAMPPSTDYPVYYYKCTLLDCSKVNGAVTRVTDAAASLSGRPSISVNAAGVTYTIGYASGATTLRVLSSTVTAGTAPTFTQQTINLPSSTGGAPIAIPNGGGYIANPVSIHIANQLHAVYFSSNAEEFYADANTLGQCLGSPTVLTPTTTALAINVAGELAVTLPVALFGSINWVVGSNGYIYPGAVAGAAKTAANIFATANSIALWTTTNPIDPTQAGGSYTLTTGTLATGETVAVFSFTGLKYSDGTAAVTGQIILLSTGVARIEVTSANIPTSGALTVSQGFQAGTQRYSNAPAAPIPVQANNCFVRVTSSKFVYLSCPTNPWNTCDRLFFAPQYRPVQRRGTIIGLVSLDADPSSATRFVFSAIVDQPATNKQLAIWTFTAGTGTIFRPAAPVLIDLGASDAGATAGAVDFDAEISSTGTWMAVLGLQASSLEPFPWSYRVLSFATLPATAYNIATARILATSIDLDTNGESFPYGAARITRRGTVNYATILLGKEKPYTAPANEILTAGTPIIFRSPDDTFASVYAAFPSPYHAINAGGVAVWPHVATDDVSVLSVPTWRNEFPAANVQPFGTFPTLTRYTNGFLAPNAQGCNSTVSGRFYTVSSRVYACVEAITQDSIWNPRSGVYTWAPIGTYDLRRQFSRPTDRAACP